MATDAQLNGALLVLMMVGREAAEALLRESDTDAQVERWLNRETKMGPDKARKLAPVLREALEGMTPVGAARSRRATPTAP